MEKILIVETIHELRDLIRIPKLSGPQREEAKMLMRELRKYGFTNADISVIIDGRWKTPTIKKFTRGVKIVSTDERDKLLRLLSDFASEGKSLQDLGEHREYKILLDSLGVDQEILAKFLSEIIRNRIQIRDLMFLNELLEKAGLTIDEVSNHSLIMENLHRQGITHSDLVQLQSNARSFGGLQGINSALKKYFDIETITNVEIKARYDLSILQSEYSKLEAKNTALKPFVDFAETLITKYSFNLESLDTLVKVAKKFGGPTSILDALAEYGSIHDLRLEKAREIKLSESFKRLTEAEYLEYINISDNVREMHEDLGEIKANYAQSLRLQRIHDLLTNPRKAKMEPIEFLRLVSALLSGTLEHAESNKESLKDWGKVELNLELSRVKINDILVGL